jgi:MraZ protein|tara:strand:- start:434 stop:898 length:465 start_codon:yes stop_codon:yes gene_type:complete
MGVPINSFEGVFDFKLDAKFRVSVPSEWRPARGEALPLRLLNWQTYQVPVLKALTDEAFVAMVASIDDSDLPAGVKGQRKGLLYSRNTPVTINEQGKLLIPKKLAKEHGLDSGGAVHLYGRGTNFDIVSPRDYAAMQTAEEALLGDLYESVDFS